MAEITFPPRKGTVQWDCPSNIALVKYWGKKPGQVPGNPSLSMTLQRSRTTTRIRYTYDPRERERSLHFRFEGKQNTAFEERIRKYLLDLEPHLPFLSHALLEIDSSNSFPHSAGIASSASAMGAMALSLVQMEDEITGSEQGEDFYQKASSLARLGSGSASRSMFPGFALWGKSALWENSSDLYAIPFSGLDDSFLDVRDAILVVDPQPKRISSSRGHALMDENPYAPARYVRAGENLGYMRSAMEEGSWQSFISVLEEEALTLHALMMSGGEGYLLMQPGTVSIIKRVRDFREATGARLGFTLDAGPNVHLLYPGEEAGLVEGFIRSELIRFCRQELVIFDRTGSGPQRNDE